MFPGVDFSNSRTAAAAEGSPQFVAGHVMVMPDGDPRVRPSCRSRATALRSANDATKAFATDTDRMDVTVRPVSESDAQPIVDLLNPIIATGKFTILDEPVSLRDQFK